MHKRRSSAAGLALAIDRSLAAAMQYEQLTAAEHSDFKVQTAVFAPGKRTVAMKISPRRVQH